VRGNKQLAKGFDGQGSPIRLMCIESFELNC